MKKFVIIFLCSVILVPQIVFAKTANSESGVAKQQNQDKNQSQERDQDGNGDCDSDGVINSQDESMDETINACKQYQNRNRWQNSYSPRSENARMHMSIVAKAVESLLMAADRMDDPGIGEQVREIARQHGQTAEDITEKEDLIADRSGVLKFFIGPDYASLDETKQLIEQIRNQVRELNQIRTQLQNEDDQTELQNQIEILELQLTNFENFVNQEEDSFSLFGWLAKLL